MDFWFCCFLRAHCKLNSQFQENLQENFFIQIAQGKESAPPASEQQHFRDKLKEYVPDKEADEVAGIFEGMYYSDNSTILSESRVSWDESPPKPRMTYFEDSQVHFLVFAVQNKVNASRDELYRAFNRSDLDRLDRLTRASHNYQELRKDLEKTLSAEDVRKVTDFVDELNRWNIENMLEFSVKYLNYAVPDKMKMSVEQFMENEIDAS